MILLHEVKVLGIENGTRGRDVFVIPGKGKEKRMLIPKEEQDRAKELDDQEKMRRMKEGSYSDTAWLSSFLLCSPSHVTHLYFLPMNHSMIS